MAQIAPTSPTGIRPIRVHCSKCDGDGEITLTYPGEPETTAETCPRCEGEGEHAREVWVTVYAVTRQWGGPEEGGWWYDAGDPLGSILVDPWWGREAVTDVLTRLYADHAYGDISSVRGGVALEVRFSDEPGEAWPAERPRYE